MNPRITWSNVEAFVKAFSRWVESVDEALAERRKAAAMMGHPVMCGRGCFACCNIHVTISAIEALRLALHLRSTGRDTSDFRHKLMQRGTAMDTAENEKAYAVHEFSCVFLGAEGECTVYAERPVVCRRVLVTSDPKFCGQDERWKSRGVDVLNVDDIAARHAQKITAVAAKLWAPVVGVLPLMVLWALEQLDTMERREATCSDSPSPASPSLDSARAEPSPSPGP